MKKIRKYFLLFLTMVTMAMFMIGCAEELMLCPDSNHPHAIDLGLPDGTKWACCNLGAPSPEHSGGYYAWGETKIKSSYNEDNYEGPKGIEDIAGTEYDAAYVNWGKGWRMPNYEKVSELLNYCKAQESVAYNGVKGFLFTGPNGNSIFLPFCGFIYKEELSADFQGYLWTSTRDSGWQGQNLKFNRKCAFHEISPREFGLNIRPIIK